MNFRIIERAVRQVNGCRREISVRARWRALCMAIFLVVLQALSFSIGARAGDGKSAAVAITLKGADLELLGEVIREATVHRLELVAHTQL